MKAFNQILSNISSEQELCYKAITKAYHSIFYKISQKVTTNSDGIYQPVNPQIFVKAMLYLINNDLLPRKVNFLDLGAGAGNILYLAESLLPEATIVGIEKEGSLQMIANIMGITIEKGDMLNVELQSFHIVHFFNCLHRDHAKHEAMYKRFNLIKKGNFLLLSQSQAPHKEYFKRLTPEGWDTQVFQRNAKVFNY